MTGTEDITVRGIHSQGKDIHIKDGSDLVLTAECYEGNTSTVEKISLEEIVVTYKRNGGSVAAVLRQQRFEGDLPSLLDSLDFLPDLHCLPFDILHEGATRSSTS